MGAEWAWLGMCELASAVQRQHVGDLPAFSFFGCHTAFHEGCVQKHTNLLNFGTSSSDICVYHADSDEGHGTVLECQCQCETLCPIYRTGTLLPTTHPIFYIFSTNTRTEFLKHAAHSPILSLQNASNFITLPFLVPV
jgi:hypothetical protein